MIGHPRCGTLCIFFRFGSRSRGPLQNGLPFSCCFPLHTTRKWVPTSRKTHILAPPNVDFGFPVGFPLNSTRKCVPTPRKTHFWGTTPQKRRTFGLLWVDLVFSFRPRQELVLRAGTPDHMAPEMFDRCLGNTHHFARSTPSQGFAVGLGSF